MEIEERGGKLVRLARDTIVHALGGPSAERPNGPWFDDPAATFVTVTRGGRLHGCIGTLSPRRSLVDDVEENAVAAAFQDPRSEAFRAEWLPELEVEVTLLGPLVPIAFRDQADLIRQLVPHMDGLVLRWNHHRGTFLPQVWETLPSPAEFIAELKRKAGLARDFWADDVEILRFGVQKWGGRSRALA